MIKQVQGIQCQTFKVKFESQVAQGTREKDHQWIRLSNYNLPGLTR